MCSTMAGSRTNGTPISSAMTSRVMSSWVGPSPPHTITASLRAKACSSAPLMRSQLSPTLVWKYESMPAIASCSPIHEEFVSTICPSSSSVPTATTSARNGRPPRVPEVLDAGPHRQHHGDPQERLGDPRRMVRAQGQQGEADGDLLHHGLDL